jgi:hypothetical protein
MKTSEKKAAPGVIGPKTATQTLTCLRCGYSWEYHGEGFYATCPRCHTKTRTGRAIPPREKAYGIRHAPGVCCPEAREGPDEHCMACRASCASCRYGGKC